jgi:hypothetical protein
MTGVCKGCVDMKLDRDSWFRKAQIALTQRDDARAELQIERDRSSRAFQWERYQAALRQVLSEDKFKEVNDIVTQTL